MPHEVRITARAETDIDDVLAWLVQRSPSEAARWHARLLEKIQTLEDQPERCPVAAEADVIGIDLHELLFGKRRNAYRVLFTISRMVRTPRPSSPRRCPTVS